MSLRRCLARATPVVAMTMVLAACTGAPTPTASGDVNGTSMVIAVPHEPVSLSPLAGYAEHGAAKIFDGLVEHESNLGVRPTLAAELPKPSPDGRSWTVRLRTGVRFTDGTEFEAGDVVATYQALRNPVFGSPLRDRYAVITQVSAVDPTTVRFELAHSYAPFRDLLVLGILPSEAVHTPAAAVGPEFTPVGTGPYQLVEWRRGERMTLTANMSYFDGPPRVTTVTVAFVKDDAARATLVRESKVDGAVLPPALAREFDNADPFTVITQRSADLRAVQLPTGNLTTSDPAIRRALNYATNRRKMVDGPLVGAGTEAETPLPPVLTEFVEPSARFGYDQDKARRLLDEAGWVPGQDGVRSRSGAPAGFTLWYPAGDAISRGLAESFVEDAAAVGIRVSARGIDQAQLAAQTGNDAIVISTGNPFDPDLSLHSLLSSARYAAGASRDKINGAIEAARAAVDPAQRAAEYRKLQRAYVEDPGLVAMVAVDHTYVMRDNWTGFQSVVDASTPDVTWGPWWNLHRWTPR
jgi:peptide/nickel transport system substrate-binding protein